MNKTRETIVLVRPKRARRHGWHGGAWKVALADFMTSLMALFLVLWIVSQSQDVRAAVAEYFQDPKGKAARPKGNGDPREPLRMLGAEIRQRLDASPEFRDLSRHIDIEVTDEGLRIQLVDDSTGVFFETGSATPHPRVARLLETLGQQLASLPNPVVIEGHTDAVPYRIDRTYSNWELSTDRANTARRLIVVGGLPEKQIREVRGHADRQPREPDAPTAPNNRRVAITMLFADTARTP